MEDVTLFEGNVWNFLSVSGTVKQLLNLITDWLYFGEGEKDLENRFQVFKKGSYKALSFV